MKKKSIIITIVGVCVLAGAALGAFHHSHTSNAVKTPVILVKLSKVTVKSIPETATTTGTLFANQKASISPKVGGYIRKINFYEGQFVKAGTVLVQLDDNAQRQAYLSDQAATKFAKVTVGRYLKLMQENAASQQETDEYLSNYKKAMAQEKSDKVALSEMSLTAPISGYLGAKSINIGDYVTPGSIMISLTDTNTLKVDYSLPSRYAPELKLGQSVTITADFLPGKEFSAKVSYIAPTVNEATQTIEVHAVLKNNEHNLKPGQSVTIIQNLGINPQTLLVPSDAIIASIDGDHVLEIKNNKVISIPVISGTRYHSMTIVEKGLNKDSEIISQGQFQVKVGTRVKAVT